MKTRQRDQTLLVVAKQPERGAVPDTVTAYGSADNNPNGMFTVSPPRAGQVVTMHVGVGQAVRKGDRIVDFVFDPASIAEWALLMTQRVEQAIGRVPGVLNIRSGTSRGGAVISLDFGW